MRAAIAVALAATTMSLAACSGSEAGNQAAANNMTAPGDLPDNAMAANTMAGSNAMMMGNAAMGPGALATLKTAKGDPAGTARVTEADGALKVSLSVQGLTPGEHGVHIHMTGKCDAPKFETAGGHWNPTTMKHGLDNPQGQHAGDMPNLMVGADGKGTLNYTLKGGSLAQLMDTDGAAFVVHAKQDDQKTDPSGDSGDRVACGVFAPG